MARKEGKSGGRGGGEEGKVREKRGGEGYTNLRNTDVHKSGKSFKYFLYTENYLQGGRKK